MRGSVTLAAIAALHLLPLAASAAGVQARFDVNDRRGGPFPSDRFTVADMAQITRLRVNLPKPDCAMRPPSPSAPRSRSRSSSRPTGLR